MSSSNITSKYDEERSRIHEQSQLVYLQGQIDELRRLIKDQTSKYNWVTEQTRKTESSVVQIQGMLERHREEVAQTVERSRRDIIDLRKEIANALVKIDEGVKPLREMQAQIQQLAEARKQDREQISPWFARIEELEHKIPVLQNQIKEVEERVRQFTMQLERLREADSAAIQEARRVGEEIQVEKQEFRRQMVETQQLVTSSEEATRELDARIQRVEELHDNLQLFAEVLPSQIAELGERIGESGTEIKRVELAATDWFMMNQERLEELRQQSNERISELQDVDEQHLTQLTSWLERVDSWVRELEQRLSHGVNQLEQAQQSYQGRLVELERRELQTLHSIIESFKSQLATLEADRVRTRADNA